MTVVDGEGSTDEHGHSHAQNSSSTDNGGLFSPTGLKASPLLAATAHSPVSGSFWPPLCFWRASRLLTRLYAASSACQCWGHSHATPLLCQAPALLLAPNAPSAVAHVPAPPPLSSRQAAGSQADQYKNYTARRRRRLPAATLTVATGHCLLGHPCSSCKPCCRCWWWMMTPCALKWCQPCCSAATMKVSRQGLPSSSLLWRGRALAAEQACKRRGCIVQVCQLCYSWITLAAAHP